MTVDKFISRFVLVTFIVSGLALVFQLYAVARESVSTQESRGAIQTREVYMRIVRNEWRWEPNQITVEVDTTLRLRILNEDSYQHGFGIQALGISKLIPPLTETVIDIPTTKTGEFAFECSVLCGRGHFQQTGLIIVTPKPATTTLSTTPE